MIKVISAAALIAAMSTSAFAGAASNATVEPAPQNDVFAAPSSSGGGLLIPAIGCLIVCTALLLDDDDDGATATTNVED